MERSALLMFGMFVCCNCCHGHTRAACDCVGEIGRPPVLGGAAPSVWRRPRGSVVCSTALTPLLFSTGISVSFTYKLWHNNPKRSARTLFDIVHSCTSMADYLYNMLVQASLLPRDARYIAHAHTQAHRTRVAALSMLVFFACALHAYSSSDGLLQAAIPSVPHARPRGRRSPRRCSSRKRP